MSRYRAVTGKITYSFLILVVYLFGRNIPIPWTVTESSDWAVSSVQDFVNSALGSGSENSILTLGIMPWVTAKIITTLLHLKSSSNEKGERTLEKSRKRRTMILTLFIAVIQAYRRCRSLTYQLRPGLSLIGVLVMSMIVMVAGSFAVIALVKRNERWGVGGQSLLILTNILTRVIKAFAASEREFGKPLQTALLLTAGLAIILVTIIVDKAEIHLPVRRSLMHNSYSSDNYIAVKLSPVGTMTAMYVMTVFSLLSTLCSLLAGWLGNNRFLQILTDNLDLYHWGGLIVFALLLFLMNHALSMTMINPGRMADRLQKGDDYIAGIRPGRETSTYLKRRVRILAAWSSIILCVMVVLPLAARNALHSDASVFMMPVSLMVLTNTIGNIRDEIHVLLVVNGYERQKNAA